MGTEAQNKQAALMRAALTKKTEKRHARLSAWVPGFSVEPEVRDALDEIAKGCDMSRTSLIREILGDYVKEKGHSKKDKSKGITWGG